MQLRLFSLSGSTILREDSLSVNFAGQVRKLYTKKGQKRDVVFLESLVEKEKKVLFVSPRPPWLAPIFGIIWLDPFSGQKVGEDHIVSEEEWRNFLQGLSVEDRFSVHIHPLLPDQQKFLAVVQSDIQEALVRLKTIRYFSKIWEWNFRHNLVYWQKTLDYRKVNLAPPKGIVLGGPQVDENWGKIKKKEDLWAADTALMPLLYRGIVPKLVASVDARAATMEHFSVLFIKPEWKKKLKETYLLLDPLAYPLLFRFEGFRKISYRNSHPLVQATFSHHGEIFNPRGDVGGLLFALFQNLFPNEPLPLIWGGENQAISGISHLRGSGYFFYHLQRESRFYPYEMYSYILSKRYRKSQEN